MKKNERQQALDTLNILFQNKTPLSHLTGPLPPFSRELCFGVCRHYIRLEALAQTLLTKKPKDQTIWLILLLGLYQLHIINLPDYAVVQESVALIPRKHSSWAKGLINAVLRNYCRNRVALIEQLDHNKAYLYNHPAWFIKRIQTAWPDAWESVLKANDLHPPMSLRVNAKQSTALSYLNELSALNIEATLLQHASQGIRLTTPCDVTALPGFSDGRFSVQDEAAQLAVTMLDLKPNLRVLDACSAPGGKACHALETEPQLKELIALDIDSRRVSKIHENMARLNLHATLITADALNPKTWWDGIPFDRILLDAPCSATGVIRRHPDIKCLRTEDDITTIMLVQYDLLKALWPLLAPGGLLVYATCSVLPEENEYQLRRFTSEHPDDCRSITPTQSFGQDTGHGRQILPGEHNMDGFFYGVLQKTLFHPK